jgi:hypothetical protein
VLNAILRLRRDNDYNYAKIKDTFIPANGEICLVDTAREGLRAVCGDGKSTFGQLEYLNDFIQKGYLLDEEFYKDLQKSEKIVGYTTRFYIDLKTSNLYFFNGERYKIIGADLKIASEEIAGVMKLYNTTGDNSDGTMTQKAITDELNQKVELVLSEEDDEMVIFNIN